MSSMLPVCLLVAAAAPQSSAMSQDMTGLQWVLPFNNALKTARLQNKLLMIKPVAFGTSTDGGW